tara:strand:- start:7376 stop:8911 length:1536 start_codon:yes stop_codon:yes gene_type:complete
MKKRIAVFDVDKTLIKKDSLILAAIKSKKGISGFISWISIIPWLVFWRIKIISSSLMKEKFLRAFNICAQINKNGDQWIINDLVKALRPEALEKLLWHQKRGNRVILCSASPRLLIEPLAKKLNVELVCTDLKKIDESWHPRLLGKNIKGKYKVEALKNYLGNLNQFFIDAYGDSEGDKELLRIVDRPHYRSFEDEPKPYPHYSIKKLLVVIAIVFLGYSFLSFVDDFGKISEILRVLLPEILIGLILISLGYFIRFLRWRLMMRSIGQNTNVINDAQIWMASFAFTATPGKSGEIVRSFLLKEKFDIPFNESLLALLAERITDASAVLFLLVINFSFVFENNKEFFPLLFIGSLLIIFLSLFLRNKKFMHFLVNFFSRKKSKKFYNSGIQSIRLLQNLFSSKIIILGTLLGALSWALEGLSFWILLQKMEQNQVNLGYAIISHTSSGLVGALSMLPGGLGATETSIIGLLNFKGVDFSLAYPLTLLIRLMTLWFATFLGVISLSIIERKN